tara:strand:- start:481 stop:855 length:375 start_codon:yes stop_codon:yes gene_type:complete
MALTVTQKGRKNVIGSRQMVTLDITFGNNYPTGGENLDLEEYVGTIDLVMTETASNGINAFYDRTNKKLKAFGTIAPSVVDADPGSNATNLEGELSVTSGYGEIENGSNLSSVTVSLVVYGTRS